MTITFEHSGKTWEMRYDGTTFIPTHTYQSPDKDGVMVSREKELGYFTNLGSAIKKIVGTTLGESDETITLATFVERYEAAVKSILGLLESEF